MTRLGWPSRRRTARRRGGGGGGARGSGRGSVRGGTTSCGPTTSSGVTGSRATATVSCGIADAALITLAVGEGLLRDSVNAPLTFALAKDGELLLDLKIGLARKRRIEARTYSVIRHRKFGWFLRFPIALHV
jgi:hypothetical protein